MSIDALISRLEHCKPAGKGRWRSQCPVHGGKNRYALSMLETADGAVLMHCHVMQCAPADICAAIGLDPAELFPPGRSRYVSKAGKGIPKPWPSKLILEALHRDLRLAWVVLGDVAHGRLPLDANVERTKQAQLRVGRLISELDRSA